MATIAAPTRAALPQIRQIGTRQVIFAENPWSSWGVRRMHSRLTSTFYTQNRLHLHLDLRNPSISGSLAQGPKQHAFKKSEETFAEHFLSIGSLKRRVAPANSPSPVRSKTYETATFFGAKSNVLGKVPIPHSIQPTQ